MFSGGRSCLVLGGCVWFRAVLVSLGRSRSL